jgi:hypothetical protein
MRLLAAVLMLCGPLSAQMWNFGVKGGFPFGDAVKTIENAPNFDPNSSNWTVGPMVDLNLPYGLGIEADALYRKVGFQTTGDIITGTFDSSAWSFPILVKYKFPGKTARLYVDGGFVFRALSDIPNLWNSTSKGFVFGGGIRYDVKIIKISPEIRYTYLSTDQFKSQVSNGSVLSTKQNQVEFLVGVTF